jgi:hypothetical protein
MKPPIVYDVTTPRSQRIMSMVAIVVNMVFFIYITFFNGDNGKKQLNWPIMSLAAN